MNSQAGEVFGQPIDRLPLTSAPHIVHANALQKDWNEVLPHEQCSYVRGNPPFVGKHYQNADQRADMIQVFGDFPNTGDLDYVTAWYVKAARYIENTRIPVAFVSTNSISQGEQVPVLWSILLQRYHLKIHFAHRTFAWASEARGKAHVHVVIVGFAAFDTARKFITDYDADPTAPVVSEVANITPYLTPGSDSFVTKQRQPLCAVPEMCCGNKPTDGGNLILTDAERVDFLRDEPGAEKFLRRFTGSEEFINGNMRWCLWLQDAAPGELRKLPRVMERVERVREFRSKSTAAPTRKAATTPTLFFYISQPADRFIAIPEVSSERRKHIPIGFLNPEVIVSNKIYVVPSPDRFVFGVLSSAMHVAWARTVGGRLKSDFQYSGSMVYNTFPWPNPTPEQRARVETQARALLAAREPHLPPRGMSTLADLYDPLTMPAALAKAHAELDRAVEKCYRAEAFHSDRERVEHLFRLYEQLTAPLLPEAPRTRHRRGAGTTAPQRQTRARTPGLPEAETARPEES